MITGGTRRSLRGSCTQVIYIVNKNDQGDEPSEKRAYGGSKERVKESTDEFMNKRSL